MTQSSSGYARPELLAEPDWLEEHLDDPNVRVIDCATFDLYQKAHIKGAVGLRVNPFIKDANDSLHVMPPGQFAKLMGDLGVGPDTTVVSYDTAGGVPACRMWWVLNHYGHTNAKVLNGGWERWFHEGRPISREVPSVSAATFTPVTNDSVLCSLDYGKAHVGDEGVIYLDVRSDGEWTGENSRGNKRIGHVPGADPPGVDELHEPGAEPLVEVSGGDPGAAGRGRGHAGQGGHHLLTGRHPCGARTADAAAGGLRQRPQLRRLHGRVGKPGGHGADDRLRRH